MIVDHQFFGVMVIPVSTVNYGMRAQIHLVTFSGEIPWRKEGVCSSRDFKASISIWRSFAKPVLVPKVGIACNPLSLLGFKGGTPMSPARRHYRGR